MKYDTSKIEGYAEMTPEQKVAALEALELPAPDYSGYVTKETFDKKASEVSRLEKEKRERMTEEEKKQAERDEELAQLRERNTELERTVSITSYKAKFCSMGYDDTLAEDTAKAWADGDMEKVLANQQTFLTAYEKKVKAGMLGAMPTPPAGSGTTTKTKQEIMAIKDTAVRQREIAAHPELFQ